jgi:hypothetical protein
MTPAEEKYTIGNKIRDFECPIGFITDRIFFLSWDPRESSKSRERSFPFKKISIKAPNGHFLKALGGGKGNWFFNMFQGPCYTGIVKAEGTAIREWEIFTAQYNNKIRFYRI